MADSRDIGDESGKDKKRCEANVLQNAFRYYNYLLKHKPILTKSITSGVVAGFSDVLSQKIVNKGSNQAINWRSVAAFSTFGLVVSGPVIHHVHLILDKLVPSTAQYASVQRVILDRLGFAPPYLFVLFYVVSLLEGKTSAEAIQKIKQVYWTALKMNWKVWTIVQYINLNYVPIQYRVLVGNIVSILWNIYLSLKRSS